jgi:hypothetical protein
MAAFVARFVRPTEPERDESRRHSTLCECFSPRLLHPRQIKISGVARRVVGTVEMGSLTSLANLTLRRVRPAGR